MGSLNIYQRFTNDPKPDQSQTKIWTISGDHGDKWRCTYLNIPSKTQYSIVFEAVRGNGYRSDVAVDDIKFVYCSGLGPTARPTLTPPPRNVMDEDFETCTSCWINEKGGHDQMDWIIGRGETASIGTGPSYDHTKKTIYGRYLYIDASSATSPGWYHADLESRLLVVQRRCYMSFWYHMYGSGTGALWIVAYVYNDPNNLVGK